jgi:hypothetical protein
MIGKEIINNIIGFFTDYVKVPFLLTDKTSIMAFLRTGYFHVHGASFLYPDKADPVSLSSSAASWSQSGAIVEIIPVNTITKNFDLHFVNVSDISADLYGVIDLFSGTAGNEVKIGSVEVTRTSNFAQEGNRPLQIPQQLANTRISARFSDSTTSIRTCKIKLYGHVYSTSLT